MTMPDRFTASPDPATRGQDLEIGFTNPALANETIWITISDGEGHDVEVQMDLNASGAGSVKWTVPTNWGASAFLSQPTSADHVVAVQ